MKCLLAETKEIRPIYTLAVQVAKTDADINTLLLSTAQPLLEEKIKGRSGKGEGSRPRKKYRLLYSIPTKAHVSEPLNIPFKRWYGKTVPSLDHHKKQYTLSPRS
jgi:hypothetical protein